jgi:hypothetical protein
MTLLSILVPLSLLVTLRLTGVLPEPPTPETITIDAVGWDTTRPAFLKRIDEWAENSYSQSAISASLKVHIDFYFENSLSWGGLDGLMFIVYCNVNLSEGYLHSVTVEFTQIDNHAAIDIDAGEELDHITATSLSVEKIVDFVLGKTGYLEATGVDRPKEVFLRFPAAWMFTDENNINHTLSATTTLTYFNGTTYQKVKIPIQMEIFQS